MSLHLPYLTHLAYSQETSLSTWSNELESPQPFSLFAQTMLEQDEKFYATFPDARNTSTEQGWRYQPKVPHSQYLEDASPQLYPDLRDYTKTFCYYGGLALADAQVGCADDGDAVPGYTEAPPSDIIYNYNPSTETSMPSVLSPYPVPYPQPTEQRNDSRAEVHPSQPHKAHLSALSDPSSPAAPAITESWDFPIVPSHQPLISQGLMRPLLAPPFQGFLNRSPSLSMECASPAAIHAITLPSSLSSRRTPGSDRERSLTPKDVGSICLTGDWQTDEMNHQMLHAPTPRHAAQDVGSLDPSVTAPSTRSRLLTRRLQKTKRSKSHPYVGAKTRSRPSSPMRLSAPPMKGRVKRIVQSKPPLACLFCRGRKIACGAPPSGSEKKSCNQCDKRGLRCAFPLESYRGVRRKQHNLREILSTDHDQFSLKFNM